MREQDEWCEELLHCDAYTYMALPSDDDPWPKDVIRISRYYKPGMLIIAPKGGIFNRVDSYEGQGNALGRDKLRANFEIGLKKAIRNKLPLTYEGSSGLLSKCLPRSHHSCLSWTCSPSRNC